MLGLFRTIQREWGFWESVSFLIRTSHNRTVLRTMPYYFQRYLVWSIAYILGGMDLKQKLGCYFVSLGFNSSTKPDILQLSPSQILKILLLSSTVCSSVFLYVNAFLKFWSNCRLMGGCKEMYREVLCTLPPASSNVSVLHNYSTIWKPRSWHWLKAYSESISYTCTYWCVCVYLCNLSDK